MRIVTFNIRGGLGTDGKRSIARVAEVLRGLRPDVACLQEVHQRLPWSGFVDQPRRLARALGMQAVFQSTFRCGIGRFGNLILTRFPLLGEAGHLLPNAGERRAILRLPERRGLLETRLQTPDGPLAVFCTHWSLDSEDRAQGAAIVAEHVRAHAGLAVVGGDLNAEPASAEVRRLAAESGLVDAGCMPTYPSDAPRARIDYVWHPPAGAESRTQTSDTLASDHRPVLLEWSIAREIAGPNE